MSAERRSFVRKETVKEKQKFFSDFYYIPIILGSQDIFPILWKNTVMDKITFGNRLKDLRKERGLGQVQLAKELGVGKSIVSLWELDASEPTLSKLIAISKFFKVSIDYLAGFED
jgi:Predicted transcriptional regulators